MKRVVYKWFVVIVIVNLIACQTVETPEQLRIAISKVIPGKSYQYYIKWIKSVDTSISCIDMYHLGIDSALAVMENCDGLLLTGGEDIFPGRYGKENDTGRCDKPDFYRDSLEFALIGKALELELPVLGICRGHQILNVYFGGSLIIDIPSDLDTIIKHRVKGTYDCFHDVTIAENSILKDITNLSEGQVNSNHHQGVDILASDLKAIAKTKDGLTEAVQWDEPYGKSYLLGIQWHPEKMDYANPLSNKIIQKFIAEIKNYSEIKSKKDENLH